MLFIVCAIDRTDQPGLRAATRDRHLSYLRSLGPAVFIAGPLLSSDTETPIGSSLIIEAANQAAAEAIVAQDPFSQVGLFKDVTVTPFRVTISNPR